MASVQQYSKQINVYTTDEKKHSFLKYDTDGYFSINTDVGVYFPKKIEYSFGALRHSVGDKIQSVETSISDTKTDLQSEAMARMTQDMKLTTDIQTEKTRAEGVESYLTATVSQETADRISQDTALDLKISNNFSSLTASDVIHTTAIATVNSRLDSEIKTRGDLFTAEYAVRSAADNTLEGKINDLKTLEATHYLYLDQRIDGEKKSREDADVSILSSMTSIQTSLQNQISSILQNTDAVALNSLAELVADYTSQGQGYVATINALTARVVSLEQMVATLQAS